MAEAAKVTGDDIFSPFRHHIEGRFQQQDARINDVAAGLGSLKTEVHTGFADARATSNAILAKLDARPAFDLAKAVSTVLQLAVLLGMMITGIIWVTTGQFGGVMAKQEALNGEIAKRLEKHDAVLDRIVDRLAWIAGTAAPAKPARKAD